MAATLKPAHKDIDYFKLIAWLSPKFIGYRRYVTKLQGRYLYIIMLDDATHNMKYILINSSCKVNAGWIDGYDVRIPRYMHVPVYSKLTS